MGRTFLQILIFLVAGAGCVLTNPTDPYASSNAQNLSSAEAITTERSKPKSIPEKISLHKAIEIALANNPALAAEKGEVAAAAARKDAAVSRALPKISARTSYTGYVNEQPLVSIGGNPQGQAFSDEISSARLLLDMPLFTSGRISSGIRAAKLQRKASSQNLARTGNQLVFDVSSVFYGILSQRQVIDSLQASRKALQEHLKDVKNLIDNDKATKVDRLRTEVRLANVREELARARNRLKIKRHTFRNLLGLEYSGKNLNLVGELRFTKRTPPSFKKVLKKAYQNRKDYKAAKREVEAKAKRVDAARAERWPSLGLEAVYGERRDVNDTSTAEDVGSVGVALTIPIFEGGLISADIREQKAELTAARESLRKLRLQVRLDVQTALSNLESARERVRATEKAVAQGKESLRIERLKHRVGEATISDVLDAQADLLESQTNYYRALADYNTASAELDLAIGRKK